MFEKIKAFKHCYSNTKSNCEGCVYENAPELCEELKQTIQNIIEKCGEYIDFEHIHKIAKYLCDKED